MVRLSGPCEALVWDVGGTGIAQSVSYTGICQLHLRRKSKHSQALHEHRQLNLQRYEVSIVTIDAKRAKRSSGVSSLYPKEKRTYDVDCY